MESLESMDSGRSGEEFYDNEVYAKRRWGEEPNADQVTQLAQEICKEDVISLLVHKLPILGWETRKDLVHCWPILLKQKVGSTYCCVQYIENHLELLDFLAVYDSKEIALNCGNMLRDCIKFPSLANDFSDTYLESANFELFFKFVELPTFDVASDAFSTFKFFNLYENLLTSANKKAILKASLGFSFGASKFPYNEALHFRSSVLESHDDIAKDTFFCGLCKVFVANPNKPREVKVILAKNNEKLLELLHNLSPGKGAEDEQFEEEEELIIKEIERVSRLPILES
ncbi:calcium-binding protein 39 [Quercus suber]|uniref:Calcium-binding protein 39 n=1 Tax=Quercus suber TaxID=58331 RepID=A0AAW0K9D7_QUESU